MISSEQLKLAQYIKSVHLSLRRKARQIGAEEAWKEHLANEEVLQTYASCMKNLAQKFWTVNNQVNGDKFLCRINWMVDFILHYFEKGGLQKEVEKENRKATVFQNKNLVSDFSLSNSGPSHLLFTFGKPYKLLDVGSCYDPFAEFPFLKTFPIDLCPATPDVKKCNFTEVLVEHINADSDWFVSDLTKMPPEFFDVVIFSLLLEYLPSSKLRYICCEKAYKLLKPNGILLIATPDSKHESANSSIMKNWKIGLAHVGFVRIKLEKLRYIYCMAFRKSSSNEYPLLLYNIGVHLDEPHDLIKIPQDFIDYKSDEGSFEKSGDEYVSLQKDFKELPYANVNEFYSDSC